MNAISLSPLYCSLWILTSVYFFIQYLVEPSFKLRGRDILSFIFPIFQTTLQVFGLGWYFIDRVGQIAKKNEKLIRHLNLLIDYEESLIKMYESNEEKINNCS